MAGVSFRNISKVFAGDVKAVNDLNLEVHDGEFMVLVGPSGCGKTTALRMIAGLEEATGGDMFIGETRVNDVPPKDRDISMVFQNYALYPNMTVYENMAFTLRIREQMGFFKKIFNSKAARKIEESINERVLDVAKMLSIEHLLERTPKALSGGQRQRVALGRAIVRKPKVFLMDEPLSNLDAKLRIQTRAELTKLHRQLGVTTIYVTHDQVEAMTMGHRMAVMKDGLLQQCDEPETVYNKPVNMFVAGFIGAPPMNFIRGGKIVTENGRTWVDAGTIRIRLNSDHPAAKMEGAEVVLGLRPETIFDAAMNNPIDATEDNSFMALVDVLEPLGPEYTAYLQAGEHKLLCSLATGTKLKQLETAKFCVNLDSIVIFNSTTEQAIY